jgi:hypothetical protein
LNANAAEFGLRASELNMKSKVAFQAAGMAANAFMANDGFKTIKDSLPKPKPKDV